MMPSTKRRGQLTLFIILGLVLLLIVGLVILLLKDAGPGTLESTQETTAVTNLVQQCLNQVGEETMRNVAANGGYLEVNLKDVPSPDSQVITIGPQRIPLWHEVQSCGQSRLGCLQDNRPPLCARGSYCPLESKGDRSIQESIERGIERDIAECLNGFSALPALQVQVQDDPDVEVYIREDDVALNLEYPLRVITAGGEALDVDDFATTLDVDLPRLYLLASQIQEEERQRMFLEEVFLHLISIYADLDGELPPFRELQLQGAPKYWVRSEVQQLIEQGILPVLYMVRVQNTQNYYPIENPDVRPEMRDYADGIFDYMAINLGDVYYPLDVRFEYPGTPMHLDINGKQLLKPRKLPGTEMLRFIAMDIRDYRFKYSASFPTLVRIDDPAAFNGRGLQLSFGLEVNIRNNAPLNTSSEYVDIAFAQTTIDLAQQPVDHLHRLTVRNERGGAPIPGAHVTYVCGVEYSVGTTDASGKWEGKLPYCLAGGYLLAWKDGYERDGVAVGNFEDDSGASDYVAQLWPLQPKTVKVYKLTAADIGSIAAGASRDGTLLGVNDSVILMMARDKEHDLQDEVPLQGVLQFGGIAPSDPAMLRAQLEAQRKADPTMDEELYELMLKAIDDMETAGTRSYVQSQRIDLIPGRYAIEGNLIYGGVLQIPEDRREAGGLIGGTSYTLPAQNFTSWLSGGIMFKEGTTGEQFPGLYGVTEEDLYAENELIIYVLEQPLPTKWKELEAYQPIEDYQLYKTGYARPEFIPAAP